MALAVVSGLGSLSIGTVLGFSAILLPQLEHEGVVAAKSEQASWIGREPPIPLIVLYNVTYMLTL